MKLKNVKVMRDKLVLGTLNLQSVKLVEHGMWHLMFFATLYIQNAKTPFSTLGRQSHLLSTYLQPIQLYVERIKCMIKKLTVHCWT